MGRYPFSTTTKTKRTRIKIVMAKRNNKSHQHKRHLLNKIETRFKTIMIGSLAKIEDNLGFLWAYDTDDKLTDEQQKYLDIWENLRNEILNHGNYHLREGLDDIEDYFDREERYSYKFIFNDQQDYRR